ncbi:MAG: metallophosphoesterase [Hyphomonadaceae bacterium]
MRLWIFSDLHIESCQWDFPIDHPEHDVIVAAGDILTPCSAAVAWLGERARKRPLIYVPGNHEWYAHPRYFTVDEEQEKAELAAATFGVTYLTSKIAIVEGVRFVGTTLWTDYELYGTPARSMAIASSALNDHRLIYPKSGDSALTSAQARDWHLSSRAWLEAVLAEPFPGQTVVVTHHLPHRRSIAPQYLGDPVTPAFCSDLAPLVENSGAALWVHGHTHCSFDYVAGTTRVVCNPKGYGPRRQGGKSENPDFDPYLVVEI